MPTIHPFLWFRTEAEEARDFYLSVFKTGRALESLRFPGTASGSGKTVPVSTFDFELDGMRVTALNAGSHPPLQRELVVLCRDRRPGRDRLLLLGADRRRRPGKAVRLAGRQVRRLLAGRAEDPPKAHSDPDRAKAERAMQAMYKMTRIVIADLEAAYAGKA